MINKVSAILFFLFVYQNCICQIGGKNGYQFLNLIQSARSTALGGGAIAIKDSDVAMAYQNPALLNESMNSQLSLNHNFHFADIQHGFANYGAKLNPIKGYMHLGINYINYGSFIHTDEFGNQIGEFNAKELAVTFGVSKPINERIQLGINMKVYHSRLETYNSFGFAGDIGAIYENPQAGISFAFVARNLGVPVSSFTAQTELLPLDIQLGISKRFAHLPFIFSVTAHHLNQWELRFDRSDNQNFSPIFGDTGQTQSGLSKAIENLFRHFIFSGEFLLGQKENIRLRFAYNHQRKKELAVSSFRSLGGFSFGFGFKIKKISFDYGVGYYHLAGATNHLGISINLREFMNKI